MAESSEGFELLTLRNGARAIRDRSSGEIMHPAVGPWNEARTLYVEQVRLADRLRLESTEPVRIYDVGLGGAANAVAALDCFRALGSEAKRGIELVSFERDLRPLELALSDPEGFPFLTPWEQAVRAVLDRGVWEVPGIRWVLLQGDVLQRLPDAPRDPEIVFHDPFSPETNTELWTVETFRALRERARGDERGTLLVTYSASTRTRVSLLLGGFFVGVGLPIGSKKETTAAATRRELLDAPLDQRWIERWRRSNARAPWGSEVLSETLEQRLLEHPQFR